jgi:hypothetical protein
VAKTQETQGTVEVKQASTPVVEESKYTRADLMANASAFGVKPEIVAGACHLAGKDLYTKTEAEQAIKAFLGREV